ncbi:MAG: multidrug ABC transporter permease [Pseudomonadota bacterium]
MIQVLKPVVSLLMFLVVLFFIRTMLSITTGYPSWQSTSFSLACAALAGWYAWKLVSGEKISVGASVISGALMLGSLCFIIGFLGPMAFVNDTSQGPLVGVFIAGPLGVILGAIGGYVYAARQKLNASD